MKEKILMTKEGVAQLKEDIQKARKELIEFRKTKADSTNVNDGRTWCDDEVEREESLIMSKIRSLKETLSKVIIIEATGSNDTVDINNIVTLEINCDSDIEVCRLRIIGATPKDFDEEVSINSPMGKAIFARKVGDEVSFEVNNVKTSVKILQIE